MGLTGIGDTGMGLSGTGGTGVGLNGTGGHWDDVKWDWGALGWG